MNRAVTIAGWIGLVLTALVIGRFAAIDPRWDGYLVWTGAAGAATVFLAALVGWRDWHKRRSVDPGASGPEPRARFRLATIGSAIGLALALTIVATIYTWRWDVTPTHVYQLAPET